MLLRETARGVYESVPCFGHLVQGVIPSEVVDIAAMMRSRNRERDIWIKSNAWDEGFTACANEHIKQRQDPNYPMTRPNPYEQVPF